MRPMARRWFVVLAGCAVVAAGCWEKETETRDEGQKPDVKAATVVRQMHFTAHHEKCVELFVKAEGFGEERRPRLNHRQSEYPRSLQLPAEADVPSPPLPG